MAFRNGVMEPMLKNNRVFKNGFLEKIRLLDIVSIIAGSFILALGIQALLVPSQMLTGGVAGIAIILTYLTRLDVGLWYALLNIPIFAAGYRLVSRRFAAYSLLGAAALSLFLALLKNVQYPLPDPLLAAVFGGAVAGAGTGIIFRFKGSTGGIDIVAVIARRMWGLNLGLTSFLSNMLVISLSLFSTSLSLTLYSTIAIFVSSQVMETVVSGLQLTHTAMVITQQPHNISQIILNDLHRGCTLLEGKGGYTGDARPIIMVTLPQTQLPRLREVVFQIDPSAFIIVNESIEVYGKGFTARGADF